jgi:hypothetical protein
MEQLPDGSVKLTQKKLLHAIFEEFHPEQVKGVRGISVPARSTVTTPDDDEPVLQRDYLRLLGMLNYLTRSRPDVATALSFAATHSAGPLQSHYDQLLLVVRYLWDTREKSLIIRRGKGPDSPLILTCYADASYLTHPDAKSHTGYCMSFGTTGTFYAKSVKQQLVATSSTHAEVRALYQCIVDIIYIVNLCDELHRPVQLPAIVMEDNQPAIDLTTSLTGRIKKCKHFLMLISFIREQVAAGLISIQKVPTEDNYADLLTKILMGLAFEDKAEYLLGIQAE